MCYYCNYDLANAVTPFDPDSDFTLFEMEIVNDIYLKDLVTYKQQIKDVIGIMVDDPTQVSVLSLFETWIQRRAKLCPTWSHLFWALREMQLPHLADQIERYVNGLAISQGALYPNPGIEEVASEEKEKKKKQGEGENSVTCMRVLLTPTIGVNSTGIIFNT